MGQQFNEVINTSALRFEELKLPDGNTYSMGATMAELQAIYTALGGDITAVNNIVTQLRNNERLVAASLNDLNKRANDLKEETTELNEITNDLNDLKEKVTELDENSESFYKKQDDILIEKDGIYQVKDNSVYPVSHPDLSTQPSTLPQRYGNLNLHEALIADGRESEIPYNAVVIKSFSFNNEICVPSICKKQKVGDKRTMTTDFELPLSMSDLDGKTMTANFNVTGRDIKKYLKITTSTGELGVTEENGVYKLGNVQISINGKNISFKYVPKTYEYVDLGLPSGTLWAKCNIGADTETDYGLFFSWGGTTGYADASSGKSFSWADYELGNGGDTAADMTKYNSTDSKTVLEPEDDAAYQSTNGALRMPTETEFEELLNTTYVTNAWVTDYNGSGVNGRLFTSVSNGNTLFIPASGYCYDGSLSGRGSYGNVWSSSVNSSNLNSGRFLDFDSDFIGVSGNYRYSGRSVRGVYVMTQPSTEITSISYIEPVVKENGWRIENSEGIIPDFTLVQYYGEDNDYYYTAK